MAETVLSILLTLLQLLTFALIGRALLSWFDPGGQWTITRMLAEVTDPVIAPLRRVIPPVGMLDLSFIVAIILIQVLERLCARRCCSARRTSKRAAGSNLRRRVVHVCRRFLAGSNAMAHPLVP